MATVVKIPPGIEALLRSKWDDVIAKQAAATDAESALCAAIDDIATALAGSDTSDGVWRYNPQLRSLVKTPLKGE